MKHVTSLVSSEGRKLSRAYELVDGEGREVDPRGWIRLLATGDVEKHVFGLRRKTDRQGHLREEFQALLQTKDGNATRKNAYR